MAFHSKELERFVARHPEAATTLFFVMIVVSVVLGLVAAAMFVKDYIGRARAQSALIRQHECTRTAERRSLNKSSAIATASHDIRGSLGGITSLIDMCYDRVPSGCEVEENLRLMRRFANDLLGLLNTLLDTSKIEAGKMELEDDEFSLAELLEEVADFYHPMAMKKGIEVVLDLCDGCSATKFAYVRGDRIKLKQILSNLVSNAVKFTSKGSISIRAWAKKPSFERTILASNPNRCLSLLSRVFLRDEDIIDKSEGISAPQLKPNCMEYIIEVDDTGKGIPKDKQKSVFENFVQVRDSSLGHHGGTGLGLGIVQSLVRLMGGDIGIVDKEPGKEGTRFKFNIFLEAGDRLQTGGGERVREVDVEAPAESSQLANAPQPHKYDGSSVVVLLIHNNERRRVVKKYMERNGVRVSVVRHWEYLQGHLRRMKTTMYLSQNSSSSKSDYTSQSEYMSMRSASRKYAGKEVPLSSLDGTDEVQQRAGSRRVNRCAPTFILFLIDVTARSFQEMVSVVEEFRRDLCNVSSKVIWLEKPAEGCKGLVESLRREDAIMSKPLHGSRLHRVLRTLPEFGGFSSIGNGEASSYLVKRKAKGIRIEENNNLEIQEHEGWNSDDEIRPINERRAKGFQANHLETTGLSENGVRPLSGLKILVAEDSPLLASLADRMLSFLGAVVQIKQNGKLALEAIVNGLEDDQVPEGSSKRIPFDLILMDCEMPEMNGFEATREIRRAEQLYGIHIPIVALTAHVSSDQVEETALAGMDAYLAKPVEKDSLVETVTRLCRPQIAALMA